MILSLLAKLLIEEIMNSQELSNYIRDMIIQGVTTASIVMISSANLENSRFSWSRARIIMVAMITATAISL